MPAFASQLSETDLDAVIAYVMTLKGTDGSGAPSGPEARPAPPEVSRGRTLFFDPVRMGGCGTCHELEDRGNAVGPDVRGKAAVVQALRDRPAQHVVRVKAPGEEAFPGIAAPGNAAHDHVYDLSSRLPVLRTFPKGVLSTGSAASWSHKDAVQSYTAADLESISEYLRWAR
jgi:mono/diheme cytochrome c family protein